MKKKKKSKGFLIITIIVIILVLSRKILPYTSVGFMTVLRTPSALGFQKQVFEMYVGDVIYLRVNRINVRVKYSCSDFRIIYVSMNGRVTALKAGTAIVYGEIGDKTISCKIKVKEK